MELGSWVVNHDSHFRKAWIPVETGYTMTLDWGDCSHSDNYERRKGNLPFVETPLLAEMFIIDRKGVPVSWYSFVSVEAVCVILDDLISSGSLPTPRIGVPTLR